MPYHLVTSFKQWLHYIILFNWDMICSDWGCWLHVFMSVGSKFGRGCLFIFCYKTHFFILLFLFRSWGLQQQKIDIYKKKVEIISLFFLTLHEGPFTSSWLLPCCLYHCSVSLTVSLDWLGGLLSCFLYPSSV